MDAPGDDHAQVDPHLFRSHVDQVARRPDTRSVHHQGHRDLTRRGPGASGIDVVGVSDVDHLEGAGISLLHDLNERFLGMAPHLDGDPLGRQHPGDLATGARTPADDHC